MAWDETERALNPENLLRARRLSEAWAENAGVCHHDEQGPDHKHDHGHDHKHDHKHDHGHDHGHAA